MGLASERRDTDNHVMPPSVPDSLEHAIYLEPARGAHGHDRVVFCDFGTHAVVALADGSGGTGAGATEAAATLICVALQHLGSASTVDQISALLGNVDQRIVRAQHGGETTGLVAQVVGERIIGASVGDSHACVIRDTRVELLTERQHRKPLLGSGAAFPVGFESTFGGGTLIAASDGLFNYAKPTQIAAVCSGPLRRAGGELAALVRLKSGALPDDLAVVALRRIASHPAQEQPPPDATAEAKPRRLLLVENDAVFAQVVTEQFLAGHEVVRVATVRAALEVAAANAFQAVLCDYDLDDAKGDEAVRGLRQAGFPGRIVAISSHDAGNAALLQAGCDSACSKLRFAGIAKHLVR